MHRTLPGAARDMIRISQLAASVKPSATLAAGAKARQLKAAGRQGLRLQPRRAGLQHARNTSATPPRRPTLGGQTHYTPASGTAEVKAAICRWYKKFHGLRVRARERDRLQRGQALDPQRPRGHRRPRRRGHHPDAVLGQLLATS